MTDNSFNLDAYLKRINYTGPVDVSEEVLHALHRAQLLSIPFENFAIVLGGDISLEPVELVEKLVNKSRGGYCFELNMLLLMALKAIGFDARPLLGRVHITGTPTGRGHLLILVVINGRPWVTDVGFGSACLRAPIALELNRQTLQDGQVYRLIPSFSFGIMLQHEKGEQWHDLYSFDMENVCPADIDYGNYFTSTHPSSLFTFARVAVRHTEQGYISLFNQTLKMVTDGTERVVEIAEGQFYLNALEHYFGINLDAEYDDLRPLSALDTH